MRYKLYKYRPAFSDTTIEQGTCRYYDTYPTLEEAEETAQQNCSVPLRWIIAPVGFLGVSESRLLFWGIHIITE